MHRPSAIAAMLFLVVSSIPVARSGENDSRAELASAQLARVSRSLERIERSLRELVDHQKVFLYLRRIELAEGRLAPLASELRDARDDVRNMGQQIAQLTGVAENFRAQVEELVRTGADPQQLSERSELDQIETMLELQQEQLEAAERRVIEAEDDLARGRDNIVELEERLEQLLEALGG